MSGICFKVTVNEKSGVAYYARCQGRTSSCTSDPETAVKRAAAKHCLAAHRIGGLSRKVVPEEIKVSRYCGGHYLAHLPEDVT